MTTPFDIQRAALTAQLQGTSFRTEIQHTRKRMIVCIAGREKRGKTHLLFDAPGPIAYMYYDKGHQGVIEKFESSKIILPAEYKLPLSAARDQQTVMQTALAVWNRFEADYDKAIMNPMIRTIGFDTDTEHWETLRLALFGRTEKVPPVLYSLANKMFSELVRKAYDYDKNLVLLSKMKKEYKGGEKSGKITDSYWTGEYERAGMSEIPYLVQVFCTTDFNFETGAFELKIEECRQNPQANGQIIPNATFPMLGMTVYPDSTPEDWM